MAIERGWGWEEEEPKAAPHSSETRTVTVTVSSGVFNFVVLETCGSESPIGGPAMPRSKFKVGETVYCHYKVKNNGDIPDKWTIVVKDKDTGSVLQTWKATSDLPVGYMDEVFKATIGTMPNKTWNLECAVTP